MGTETGKAILVLFLNDTVLGNTFVANALPQFHAFLLHPPFMVKYRCSRLQVYDVHGVTMFSQNADVDEDTFRCSPTVSTDYLVRSMDSKYLLLNAGQFQVQNLNDDQLRHLGKMQPNTSKIYSTLIQSL